VSLATDLRSIALRLAAIDGEPMPARREDGAFEDMIRREAIAVGVDPSLVNAVARTESGMNPAATSRVGAQGIMQLMPATARALGVTDPYDPAANIRGGATYLRGLLDHFNGNVRLAVAAYNAGPGAVERYGGVPPFAETQQYVARVLDAYRAKIAR